MYYKKIDTGSTIIEFHNSWTGEETIIIAGKVVSQKSSILGTHHHFVVLENGEERRYVLTTKLNGFQLLVDVRKDGKMIIEDLAVPAARKPDDKLKREALKKLNDYDLENAIVDFKKHLDIHPEDSEIYFHMACAYSVMENVTDAYESLRLAVYYGLPDKEMILKHPMLAFLRMHHNFEEFYLGGFKSYNIDK